jgi:hypothetical protein
MNCSLAAIDDSRNRYIPASIGYGLHSEEKAQVPLLVLCGYKRERVQEGRAGQDKEDDHPRGKVIESALPSYDHAPSPDDQHCE